MPSFKPTRDYLLRLTEELIEAHKLSGPFLEIGCGDGAISVALARHGWTGVAMDLSGASETATRARLLQENFSSNVQVLRADFLECAFEQKFNVIVLYDVLEHVAQDRAFLGRIRASLVDDGFLLFSVPVKMTEWRWDDDGYGHLRRYESHELQDMLNSHANGFETLVQWDITFPVLWMMRRLYLFMRSPPRGFESAPIEARTEQSAFSNAGGKGLVVRIAEWLPVWKVLYWLQDRFRNRNFGCNTLILARAVPVDTRNSTRPTQDVE